MGSVENFNETHTPLFIAGMQNFGFGGGREDEAARTIQAARRARDMGAVQSRKAFDEHASGGKLSHAQLVAACRTLTGRSDFSDARAHMLAKKFACAGSGDLGAAEFKAIAAYLEQNPWAFEG